MRGGGRAVLARNSNSWKIGSFVGLALFFLYTKEEKKKMRPQEEEEYQKCIFFFAVTGSDHLTTSGGHTKLYTRRFLSLFIYIFFFGEGGVYLCRVDFRASKRNYHNYTAAIVFFFLAARHTPKMFFYIFFFFCSKFKFFQINAGTSCPNKRKKKKN